MQNQPPDPPLPECTPAADHELLERIVAREADALEALLRRYWTPLVGYAVRSFGLDPDECSDVVQEVFIRVWNLTRWDRQAGTVQSFLFRVARNLILSQARQDDVRRRGAEVLAREAAQPETPVERLLRLDVRGEVLRGLLQLPTRRREALVLVRLHGFTLDEAAELMNLSKQTVANHVTAALADLRSILSVPSE